MARVQLLNDILAEYNKKTSISVWRLYFMDDHKLRFNLDHKCKTKCNPNKRVHLWLARMYAQMEKFVLASSTLETPCYAAPDLEAEELAELKSDLGSYYNALAKSLFGSSQMDSNKNPEESLKQAQHARKRAIEVVEEAVELKPGDANLRVKLAQVI